MPRKPQILIVCDVPGWAYDNVSSAIMKVLHHDYDFHKVFARDLPIIDHQIYDAIYCMYWRSDFLERNQIPREILCLQVASFWSWQEKYKISLETLVEKYLNRACAVSVNCPGLFELIGPLHPAVFLNPSGVDIQKFHPLPPRSTEDDDVLIVGWTGSTTAHGDNKGLDEFIRPACLALKNVQLKALTKESQWLPHTEMSKFYRDIDVYVCASKSEGTPNPVLEAAASSRAVISTRVGIVPMLIKQEVNGLIIDRNLDQIRHAIQLMRDNRKRCVEMGIANRKIIDIEGWSWKNRAMNYKKLFDRILNVSQ